MRATRSSTRAAAATTQAATPITTITQTPQTKKRARAAPVQTTDTTAPTPKKRAIAKNAKTSVPTLALTAPQSVSSSSSSLDPSVSLSPVTINRAPVLTLWAALCAHYGPEKLSWEEALTVGRYIAGLLAQSRGRAAGIFSDPRAGLTAAEREERRRKRKERMGEHEMIHVMGIETPVRHTAQGTFALSGGQPISGRSADSYIQSQFKEDRDRVIAVMVHLIKSVLSHPEGESLIEGNHAYQLYEQFRPTGAGGSRPQWGQKGQLDLQAMVQLAEQQRKISQQLRLTTSNDPAASQPHNAQTDGDTSNTPVVIG